MIVWVVACFSNILCTKEKNKVSTIKPWSVFDQAGLCRANILVDTKQAMNGQQKAQLHLQWIHYMIQNNTHISFVWTFFWDFTNVCADCLSFSLAHLYPAGPSPSPPDTLPTTFTYWIVEGPNKKKKKHSTHPTKLYKTQHHKSLKLYQRVEILLWRIVAKPRSDLDS